jgi:hypothetical protein
MGNGSRFAVIMKILALVTSAMTAIFAVAHRLIPTNWLLPTAITFGTTAYHFCMRLAVGYLIPKLPLDPQHPWFRPCSWEPALYKALRVKQWKGKLPTYDPREFSLKEQTLEQILRNMCGAELVHETIMVLSLVPIGFSRIFGELPVFLATSLAACLFDGLFVMAQRYNRPRLVRLAQKRK